MPPAPGPEERAALFRAALRAPDHARLRPWRFLVVEGEARKRLGETFVAVARAADPDLDAQAEVKLRNAPLRAPLLIVVLARLREHAKVPEVEQLLSAGAAAENLLVGLHALGYGAIWRTGAIAYQPALVEALGYGPDHRVVAFLYVGTHGADPKPLPELDPDDYVRRWS